MQALLFLFMSTYSMLDTLEEDIKEQLRGGKGWNDDHTEYLLKYMSNLAVTRLKEEQKERDYLSLSMIGTPCKRKLWQMVNTPERGRKTTLKSLGTFLLGDLLEGVVLALAKAAGYKVEGEQDELEILGVKGHRDCVIEGMTGDVKTTNHMGMLKFRKGFLRKDDPFGYMSQLSSYVAAAKDDPLVTYKNEGFFLAVQKDSFDIAVDTYDLSDLVANKYVEVQDILHMLKGPIPADRLPDEPVRKATKVAPESKNRKLCTGCNFCNFKAPCWPEARIFDYAGGPLWLSKIVSEPKVREIMRSELEIFET